MLASPLGAQGTRLLRQPTLSGTEVAFAYGADIWVAPRAGGAARRLTSTPAVESDPKFSPDGKWITFASNRSGVAQVYVVSAAGGEPVRLTWYPAPSYPRGWSPDGARILYASSRGTAPTAYDRLWTVARTGGPSSLLVDMFGHDASWSADGKQLVVDRVTRWDVEWRGYRGGQNTPLRVLDLASRQETPIPSERTQDINPVWLGGKIFFLSDRDWATNVWSYDPATKQLAQLTHFRDADAKSLGAGGGSLVVEQDGWLHLLDPATGALTQLAITVDGDFPWVEPRWEDLSRQVVASSLSPTGKRVLFAARGELFTVPVEQGDTRNLTHSSAVHDRTPIWSPDGKEIAWFADSGRGYRLHVTGQDGLGAIRAYAIAPSKMAWTPLWSPDGKRIAFVDDRSRVQVLELASGKVATADANGSNSDRTNVGLSWSPDGKWLAYAKYFPNGFHRIVLWSVESGKAQPVTDALADAIQPAFDRDGRHLWFLASTNLALASGWANTSAVNARPQYGVYALVLRGEDASPLAPKSDEEAGPPPPKPDTSAVQVKVDFAGAERRIIALPLPVRSYADIFAGPKGTAFIAERADPGPGLVLHKFTLSDAKTDVFVRGVDDISVSADGKKLLYRSADSWTVTGTDAAPQPGKGTLKVTLRARIDRQAEWQEIFDEVWHYEKDFFYDPGTHGNDWDKVRERYRPLVPHVRHRADLNYVLDQVNGELSVGHSFVRGGDLPAVDTSRVGTLGTDLVADRGRWRIGRIYTFESWNPGLAAPLDRPGLRAAAGHFLLAVNGQPLTSDDDPYRLLDGTADRQTVLTLNDRPTLDSAWTVVVTPVGNELQLRQRAWVEDNRRFVDEKSGGKLAYAWIPNTGPPGTSSFDRYLFAQQDRLGAIIDERFNGGGLLDDYMVDHMTRTLRAAITNEAAGGVPFRLPQGVLGPKALLINEMAGSGGDYFPWAFRQQKVGPLIGTRTWGGLVASAVPYPMVDGGTVTAPATAVFDPIAGRWIAENEGVPPDIEVLQEAKATAAGRDPQLDRAVEEVLRAVAAQGERKVTPPPFSRPSRRP